MIRFTKENFEKFFTHDKKTTIRFSKRKLKSGWHKVYSGSRFNPIYVGDILIKDYSYLKTIMPNPVHGLTDEDARLDGFGTKEELIMELARLNPKLENWNVLDVYKIGCVIANNRQGVVEQKTIKWGEEE